MISKIFLTGKSFRETCNYVCQDLVRAEVLAVEGVRGHDHRLMAEDFALQHQFTPEKEKPVFHGMLSWPKGERPDDGLMVEIAQRYLQEIGMTNTQYAIVKHIDKEHLHVHVLANRVDNGGQIIGKGLIIERGIKAAQMLTREYHLSQERGKNLELTHLDALYAPDQKRYRLYQVIDRHLPGCKDFEDLEKRLLMEGATLRFRVNTRTGEREGVSFRMDNIAFGGKQIDEEYSYRKLKRRLEEQKLELELKQQREQAIKHGQSLDNELSKRQQQRQRQRITRDPRDLEMGL